LEAALSDLTVLRRASVFAPEALGICDVLLAGERIVALSPSLDLGNLDVREIDVAERRVVPGLVDGHLHIVGGGGNEGYESRIPELWLGELAVAGITTVVAPPGLDMVAKNLEAILAKAYALANEGLTAYAMVGGFQRPFQTLTGSLLRDVFTVEKIVGIKIALGERKASRFEDRDLVELAAQLEWLAGATGKACLMHAHLGQSPDPAAQLLYAMRNAGASPDRFQATHCNYTPDTIEAGVQVARAGGFVDVNPILRPDFGHEKAFPVEEAIPSLLEAGVDSSLISISTDGNASVPMTLPGGGHDVYEKSLTWQWESVLGLVRQAGLPFEQALSFATSNPARALRLSSRKGRIRVGADADLLVLGPDLEIDAVFARGRQLVSGGRPLALSLYEPGRERTAAR
jgi:beta-aspartyl-dipeptidase (metallo-type)